MKRKEAETDNGWTGIIELAQHRSKFFLKHGERFDRRLYAEVDSLIRLSMKFTEKKIINTNRDQFKQLVAIQRELLDRGQTEYVDFP